MSFLDKQGQTVHRTEVINKLDQKKNIFTIRQTYLHTEKRAEMKMISIYRKYCNDERYLKKQDKYSVFF